MGIFSFFSREEDDEDELEDADQDAAEDGEE